jgi:hypothetical protein
LCYPFAGLAACSLGGRLAYASGGTLVKLSEVALAAVIIAFLYFAWRARSSLKLTGSAACVAPLGERLYRFFVFPDAAKHVLPPVLLASANRHPGNRYIGNCGATDGRFPFRRPAFALEFYVRYLSSGASRLQHGVAFCLSSARSMATGHSDCISGFNPDLWTISYFNPQAVWIGMDPARHRFVRKRSSSCEKKYEFRFHALY